MRNYTEKAEKHHWVKEEKCTEPKVMTDGLINSSLSFLILICKLPAMVQGKTMKLSKEKSFKNRNTFITLDSV